MLFFSRVQAVATRYAAASPLHCRTDRPFVRRRHRWHAHFPHKTPSFQNTSLTHNFMLGLETACMVRVINTQYMHNNKWLMSHSQICLPLASQPGAIGEQKGGASKEF